MSAITTDALAAIRRSVTARPMPPAPPVTSAELPVRSIMAWLRWRPSVAYAGHRERSNAGEPRQVRQRSAAFARAPTAWPAGSLARLLRHRAPEWLGR